MVLAVLEVSDRLAVVVPKGAVEDEVKETGEEWMHIYCEFEDNPQEHTHKYIYIYIYMCSLHSFTMDAGRDSGFDRGGFLAVGSCGGLPLAYKKYGDNRQSEYIHKVSSISQDNKKKDG